MRGLVKGVIGAAVVAAAGTGAVIFYRKRKANRASKEVELTMEDALALRFQKVSDNQEQNAVFVADVSDNEPLKEKTLDVEDGGDDAMRKGTDPNSVEALEQYINMKTAEFTASSNEDVILRMLFRHPFKPRTTGDRVLYGALLDERIEFFGAASKWSSTVTWSDLILHYAEKLSYDMEEGIEHWINYIIYHLGLKQYMSHEMLNGYFEDLAEHVFVNNTTGYIGLFGLDDEAANDLHSQLEYSLEKKHSFEMEFNSFLKMLMASVEGE